MKNGGGRWEHLSKGKEAAAARACLLFFLSSLLPFLLFFPFPPSSLPLSSFLSSFNSLFLLFLSPLLLSPSFLPSLPPSLLPSLFLLFVVLEVEPLASAHKANQTALGLPFIGN